MGFFITILYLLTYVYYSDTIWILGTLSCLWIRVVVALDTRYSIVFISDARFDQRWKLSHIEAADVVFGSVQRPCEGHQSGNIQQHKKITKASIHTC